jgi:hypothetical protein
MNPEILINALGPSSLALVVFYFYIEYKKEKTAQIARLEEKLERAEKEQEATLERLITFYEVNQMQPSSVHKKEPELSDSGSQ